MTSVVPNEIAPQSSAERLANHLANIATARMMQTLPPQPPPPPPLPPQHHRQYQQQKQQQQQLVAIVAEVCPINDATALPQSSPTRLIPSLPAVVGTLLAKPSLQQHPYLHHSDGQQAQPGGVGPPRSTGETGNLHRSCDQQVRGWVPTSYIR